MNKEEFIKAIKDLGINISDKQLNQLEIYKDFLKEYNSHTNLTAIDNDNEIYLKHFYDSLTITKAYKFSNEKVLDIGTGAGFPGMVLKIIFPNIELTLMDSNNKKIKFLEELIKKIDIKEISLVNKRAEDYIREKREYYDVVTSRAVANLTTLSEISLPYVKVGGYFIPLKGSNKEEIQEAEFAITVLGGKEEKIINFILPSENSDRNILLIKKVEETSKKYPRQYNQILKYPLKKKVK